MKKMRLRLLITALVLLAAVMYKPVNVMAAGPVIINLPRATVGVPYSYSRQLDIYAMDPFWIAETTLHGLSISVNDDKLLTVSGTPTMTASGTTVDMRDESNDFQYTLVFNIDPAPERATIVEAADVAVWEPYKHEHVYEWVTTKEPTEEEDGETAYMCNGCGYVLYRYSETGQTYFCINTFNKILNAKPGETLHISTTHWLSFNKPVFDALASRPDVTLVVDFLSEGHKGDLMSFTIPAGAGGPNLVNADGYAGFHYLSGLFATGN